MSFNKIFAMIAFAMLFSNNADAKNNWSFPNPIAPSSNELLEKLSKDKEAANSKWRNCIDTNVSNIAKSGAVSWQDIENSFGACIDYGYAYVNAAATLANHRYPLSYGDFDWKPGMPAPINISLPGNLRTNQVFEDINSGVFIIALEIGEKNGLKNKVEYTAGMPGRAYYTLHVRKFHRDELYEWYQVHQKY